MICLGFFLFGDTPRQPTCTLLVLSLSAVVKTDSTTAVAINRSAATELRATTTTVPSHQDWVPIVVAEAYVKSRKKSCLEFWRPYLKIARRARVFGQQWWQCHIFLLTNERIGTCIVQYRPWQFLRCVLQLRASWVISMLMEVLSTFPRIVVSDLACLQGWNKRPDGLIPLVVSFLRIS